MKRLKEIGSFLFGEELKIQHKLHKNICQIPSETGAIFVSFTNFIGLPCCKRTYAIMR